MRMPMMDERAFGEQLSRAVAWLEHEKPFIVEGGRMRRTSRLLVDEAFAADHPEAAFEYVVAQRARLLREAGATMELGRKALSGRVLLLLTNLNLRDGAAEEPSGGLIGQLNVPLCDTWIAFLSMPSKEGKVEPALACWIPRYVSDFAQRAIEVNPEECLVWADEWSQTTKSPASAHASK
jgi:hypothetical protein